MGREIRIKDIFDIIKRRLWVILVLTLLATGLSGIYSYYTTVPLYQSSVRILLQTERPDAINTMSVILKDQTVLDKVIERLGLNRSVKVLSNQISISNENGSQIVKISVVDASPELSAQIANTTSSVFIKEIGNILGIYDSKIISEAKVEQNPSPVNETPLYNMHIGFAVGLVLSTGLVILLGSLDDSIRSEQEVIQLLGAPILGSISEINRKNLRNRYGKKSRTILKGGTIDV